MTSIMESSEPDAMVNQAEENLAAIKDFREDIKTSLRPILEQLKVVREKFTCRVCTENKSEGILTEELSVYLGCLTVDNERLE